MNKFPSHKHSFQRNIVKNNIKQILIPQNSSEKDRKQKTNLR